MRADRLLSLMLLLQSRGQMTAAELAAELEVSKRTIYRDVDALSASGVPVYATGGPGGGYGLVDSYRSSLTGLNEAELQALFMLSLPGPLADLNVGQQLKSTVLKLTSAFPARYQVQAAYLQSRLHLDGTRWFQPAVRLPWLPVVQQAVWQDRRLSISYRRADSTISNRTLAPYALVAKTGIWYLVAEVEGQVEGMGQAEGAMRVYRVARIEHAEPSAEQFPRRAEFDLLHFWQTWVAAYEATLPRYPVTLRIGPDLLEQLPFILGEEIRGRLAACPPDSAGRRTLDYNFERLEEARMVVLGMGADVEVLAPDELRRAVIDTAAAIVDRFGTQPANATTPPEGGSAQVP